MKKDRKYFNEKFKILNNQNSNTRKIINARALELGVHKETLVDVAERKLDGFNKRSEEAVHQESEKSCQKN